MQAIKPIMAPATGLNVVLVSETGALVNKTIANLIWIRAVISLVKARGRWSAITVKGSITSKTKKIYQGQSQIQIKTMDLTKEDKNKFRQAGKNWNILVNEIASVLESAYLVEQVEVLPVSLRLCSSESDWLQAGVKEVTIDEASSGNVNLYKVGINDKQVNICYDTGAPLVSWQNVFTVSFKISLS